MTVYLKASSNLVFSGQVYLSSGKFDEELQRTIVFFRIWYGSILYR
jgi:hypothetical protein